MSRIIRPLAATVSALVAVTMPALASDDAPLPDGFRSGTTAKITGLYAHAIEYRDPYGFEQSIRAAEAACRARGRELEHSGDVSRGTVSEYWLYRSGPDTVVFETSYTVELDADRCRVAVVEKRNVTHGTRKPGQWPRPFDGGRACSRFLSACYTEEKLGVKARCLAESNGFQGSRQCVSIDRGSAHGLLLESSYESDDMSGEGFRMTDLRAEASLDASLFDGSRAW